jgi:leucyl-tRNA synthetase
MTRRQLINSRFLDGMTMTCEEAMPKSKTEIFGNGRGKRKVNFRLRDWGISRQRYWGCPIPIIHCPSLRRRAGAGGRPAGQAAGDDVTFDKPGNPLDRHPTWKHVKCPNCGADARRETDTMDTFVDSSWYFALHRSVEHDAPTTTAVADRWLPVDQYIGGIEHAILHLLYSAASSPAP